MCGWVLSAVCCFVQSSFGESGLAGCPPPISLVQRRPEKQWADITVVSSLLVSFCCWCFCKNDVDWNWYRRIDDALLDNLNSQYFDQRKCYLCSEKVLWCHPSHLLDEQ